MEEIIYLFFTILVEIPVAIFLLRKKEWPRVFMAVVSVNMVSHPTAWLLMLHGGNWWIVESVIAVFEGAIFTLLFPSLRYRAFFTAVAMNVASALVGIITHSLST